MAEIQYRGLTKVFSDGTVAVDSVDLAIGDGEFMVLVGPSGCGKTTLLRSIGGLERVTSGRILIGDRDVTTAPPGSRDLAMVFQNYALYPHMNVRENLGYALKVRRMPKREIRQRVEDVAATPLAAALQPDWIVEALGLRVIPEAELGELSVKRGQNPDHLVLTHRPSKSGHDTVVRIRLARHREDRVECRRADADDVAIARLHAALCRDELVPEEARVRLRREEVEPCGIDGERDP